MPSVDEANLALRQAITAVAEAYGILEPGEAVGDLAIVAYVYPGDDAELGSSRYLTLFGQDTTPDHVVRGLLHSALNSLDEP